MSDPSSVEEGVVALIRSEDLQESVAMLAEAGIDQLIEGGFLRDVPVLGSVLGTIRAAGSIRDFLLAKKLGRFLVGLQSVPLQERQRFAESLGTPDERRRIGEALLLLLDRLDDMKKPELVARLFRAFLAGEIDRKTFHQMATAVDRLLLDHLSSLEAFYASGDSPRRESLDLDLCQALSFAGLVRVQARGNGGGIAGPEFAGAVIDYKPTDFGRQFLRIVMRDA